jgi:CheY-like chemotaxis protein
MWRVLCVDDDPAKAEQIAEYFTSWRVENPIGDFETQIETEFSNAVRRLETERFDLVTLDLHSEADAPPAAAGEAPTVQQGQRVLNELKQRRFVPVIFYSGYAEKIADLQSLVVKVVKKGEDDLAQVRGAAKALFATRLPELIRHIEKEQRSYLWDTIDRQSSRFAAEERPEELLYLLARRIAARLNRGALKEMLGYAPKDARPIEFYIYPPSEETIRTGCLFGPDGDGTFWIVATPSCDFEQGNAERILMVGAKPIATHERYAEWQAARAVAATAQPSRRQQEAASGSRNRVRELVKNRAGDRLRFLPGTFFLPDLLVDMQVLQQVTISELEKMPVICRLDAPYREDLLLHLSHYYGRLGTPDLDMEVVFKRLELD